MLLRTIKTFTPLRGRGHQAHHIFTRLSSEGRELYGTFWRSENKKLENRNHVSNLGFREGRYASNTYIQRRYFSSSLEKKDKVNGFYLYLLLVSLFFCYFLKWCYEQESSKNEDQNKAIVSKYLLEAFKLLQEGKINKAIVPLVNAGRYCPEIYQLIKLIEDENFKSGIELAGNIFTEKLDLKHYFTLTKAIFLASLKKEAEALGHLEEVLRHSKESEVKAYAHYHKSIIFTQQKQHAKAKEEMQKAIVLCKDIEQLSKNYTAVEQTLSQYIKTQTSKENKKNITKSRENRIVIRVWKNIDGSEVGHAALETNKYYISFWPSKPKDPKERKSQGRGARHNTLIQDFREEGRLPECRVVLYSLNVNEIDINYKKFIDSNHQWSLWSPNIFRDPNSHNCSSLVGFLLSCAGLHTLLLEELLNEVSFEMKLRVLDTVVYWFLFPQFFVNFIITPGNPFGSAIPAPGKLYFIFKNAQRLKEGVVTTPNDIAKFSKIAERIEGNRYHYVDKEVEINLENSNKSTHF